jgi:PAS domain S-box-containing protein
MSQLFLLFLERMINESFLPLAVFSADGQILACSPSFCVLLGYEEAELVDEKSDKDLTPAFWWESDKVIQADITKTGLPKHYRKELLCKDGRALAVQICSNRVYNTDNTPSFYYMFVTEMDVRKEQILSKSLPKNNNKANGQLPTLEDLIRDLSSEDSHTRIKATAALGKIKSKESVEALTGALRDSNKDVRLNACLSLGDLGVKDAVPSLILALEDTSSSVRWGAAMGLKKLLDKQAIPRLKAALRDKDIDVRRAAREALEAISLNRK